jgi:macrolide transport system ATP-binding/permease protein
VPVISAPSSFHVVLDDVSRTLGVRRVLDGVRESVMPGERIGVVGENGTGKTTLLRLLAGIDAPDAGSVAVHVPGGVGYLPQVPDLPPGDTVGAAIDHALRELRALETQLRQVEAELATATDLDGALARYAELTEAFEARDGYAADARVEAALHGLGLAGIGHDRLLGSLSGGEQARLGLACVLAAAPQLMLLDEPTNHLDAAALDWLEEHLRGHRGAIVVVSHDRRFLERVATALWEVDGGRRTVHRHGGGYAGFVAAKAADRRQWEERYAQWQEELAAQRDLARTAAQRFEAGPRGNTDRVGGRHQRSVEKQISARVRNAKERVRRLEAEPVAPPPQPLRFSVTLRARRTQGDRLVAQLHGVRVTGRLDVREFSVAPGERMLVTGPNGAGKSTLVRVLAGDLQPDHGRVEAAGRVAWLPQESAVADPALPLLAAFAAGEPGEPEDHRGALLGFGLFGADDLATPVGALSAGQRRRLALARVLRDPGDLLLLDEPTNHLSTALVEDLETALAGFDGAVVAVSHDRTFVERFPARSVELTDGRIRT